jgi:hypothetical protein
MLEFSISISFLLNFSKEVEVQEKGDRDGEICGD